MSHSVPHPKNTLAVALTLAISAGCSGASSFTVIALAGALLFQWVDAVFIG